MFTIDTLANCSPFMKSERNGLRTVSFPTKLPGEDELSSKSKYRDGPIEDHCQANER